MEPPSKPTTPAETSSATNQPQDNAPPKSNRVAKSKAAYSQTDIPTKRPRMSSPSHVDDDDDGYDADCESPPARHPRTRDNNNNNHRSKRAMLEKPKVQPEEPPIHRLWERYEDFLARTGRTRPTIQAEGLSEGAADQKEETSEVDCSRETEDVSAAEESEAAGALKGGEVAGKEGSKGEGEKVKGGREGREVS